LRLSPLKKWFLETGVKEIRIFSRDEKKQDNMRKRYRNRNIKFFLGDVRDLQSVRPALYGVDYVFNAAALKQIPSCELLLFPESSLAHLKRVNRVNGFHSFINANQELKTANGRDMI